CDLRAIPGNSIFVPELIIEQFLILYPHLWNDEILIRAITCCTIDFVEIFLALDPDPDRDKTNFLSKCLYTTLYNNNISTAYYFKDRGIKLSINDQIQYLYKHKYIADSCDLTDTSYYDILISCDTQSVLHLTKAVEHLWYCYHDLDKC